MKEATIRAKVKNTLAEDGWHLWCPVKARFHETDIFGVFDGVAIKQGVLRFLQWTTSNHIAARKRKIEAFTDQHGRIPCEIWGIRPDGTFRIVELE